MGRCYEFGVTVEDGCDHAMVVSAEGGVCECSECGASCRGRFTGCEAVLARPGHVPIAAPRHLVDSHRPRSETVPLLAADPSPGGALAPSMAAEAPGHVPARSDAMAALETLPKTVEALGEAIDALGDELRQRDDDLTAVFDRLSSAYERVARELASDRNARDRLVAAVEDLSRRVDALDADGDRDRDRDVLALRLRLGRRRRQSEPATDVTSSAPVAPVARLPLREA